MKQNPDSPNERIRQSVRSGLEKGWRGFIWLLKIILPVSFVTGLLVHWGLIYRLDFLLTPLMNWLGLPASGALVIMAGFFTGIYGTVAALSVMPFALEHQILLAIFALIAHNIIQESLVQGQSGLNAFVAGGFRILVACIVTFCCAKIMGVTPELSGAQNLDALRGAPQTFREWLMGWGAGTFWLILQIFCIIMPLMVLMEMAKRFQVIDSITRPLRPVLAMMGLDRSCGLLWMTAVVFGLAYGSAVIVEETRAHAYDRESLIRLHLSIGVNHAIIEDPILFLPLGLPAFWLWIPRLLAAMIVTYLITAVFFFRRLYAQRTGHPKVRNY
jgi:hypothetical protein